MPTILNSVLVFCFMTVPTVLASTCNTELTTCTLQKECGFSPGDFKQLLNSIEIVLEFMERNLDILLADAAFGTLVLQSQIKLIQEGHHNHLPPLIQLDLMKTQEKSQMISERIVENLMNNPHFSAEAKENQLHWISNSSLWLTPNLASGWESFEMPANQVVYTPFDLNHEILNDVSSDFCVKQLYNDCNISSECVHIFMTQLHSGYSLTHQVLFLIVARKEKCHLKWFKDQGENNNTLNQFMESLCRKVFQEANFIEKKDFPIKFRDIFSEQVAVCALSGYRNFLQPKWLRKILSWQSRTSTSSAFGCFSKQELKTKSESNSISRRRRKRYDALIPTDREDCSIHFTSVSLGALAMYFRYYFDSCSVYDEISKI